MQTIIKFFRLNPLFLFALALLHPLSGKAQEMAPGEQHEKILFFWSLTMEQVRVQMDATEQEYSVFNRFYKHSIDSVHVEFFHKVNDNNIGINDAKEYMLSKKPFFINLFNKFRKIEQEFPSSVDEYKSEPKFRPVGDSCFATCTNTGFEDGTLNGWYGYYGYNSSVASGPFNITGITGGYCGAVSKAGGPDPNTNNDYQIHVTSGSATDYFLRTYSTYSLFQVSPWGGTHSVMLGDSVGNNYGSAILSQSFKVSQNTSSLTYQFAVFLERNPNHSYYLQPLFSVTILDQNQDTIKTCGNYLQSALDAGQAGYNKTYYRVEGDSVYWKPWTIVNVPLKQYIGQCITIIFEVWDCSQGGHFAYAYVDASCSPLQVLSSSPNFCGQDSISLTAPPGSASYTWTGPIGGIRGSDSGQTIYIDSAGVYRVITIPVTGVACADTLYDTIGKLPGPFPHPSFIADSVCAGTPTKFINTSHPDSGQFSWDFYNIGIYNYTNMNNDDTTWVYSSPGTYTVKLHQLANGCGLDTLEKVLVYPTIGAVTHTAAPLCTGDSTLFTATAANATKYEWNFGDPPSGPLDTSDLQHTGHVYHRAGTYTVTIKALANCQVDTSFVITIIATPTPKITGDTLVCVNTTDVLTATGGSTYVWTPGNLTGSTVTVIPHGSTVYTVTASNGACSAVATFTVNTFPPPVTSVSPKIDTICAGDTVVITGSGIGVYKWSTGSTNTSIRVAPIKTTTYHLRDSVKGSLCLDTASATIVVRPALVGSISHDTSICPNQPVTISAVVLGEPTNFIWSTGATTASINVAPATTTTYTALASGIYCYHDTLKCKVTVVPLATPTITGQDWACKGGKNVLTITGGTSYMWQNGSSSTSYHTGDIENDSVIYVTAFNSLGCPTVDSFPITLRQPPVPTINPPAIFCAGQPITLTANATGSNGPFTYTWSYKNETGTSITIDPGPDSATTYTVKVSNGCTQTASTIAIPNTPILNACCSQSLYIENDTAVIFAGGNSIKYEWIDSNNVVCLNPPLCDSVRVSPTTTTSYTVIGEDTNGCTTERVITITIEIPCFDIVVPNVFTPDNAGPSGVNNVFYLATKGKNIDGWSVTIFDRWGKQMFSSTNPYEYWDGTTKSGAKAPDGVYYYIIDGTCQNRTYKQDGFVQLIR